MSINHNDNPSRASGKGSSNKSLVVDFANGSEPTRSNANRKKKNERNTTSPLSCFYWALTRKKPLDRRTETSLNRCLGLLDLTTLGVGSTLGLGLYVLAGNVASSKAGPAVIISFAFAALASAFSALCYAEFAGMVPRAGSAYVYSYITVGEFAAFFIGWNLILEYAIGAAAVTRGFTDHMRTLYDHVLQDIKGQTSVRVDNYNGTMSSYDPDNQNHAHHRASMSNLHNNILQNGSFVATQLGCQLSKKDSRIVLDWIPFLIVAIITIPIAIGAKCSTRVTFVFTAINLTVVACIIVSGIIAIDGFENWHLPENSVHGFGSGGFMPYGWAGVFAGASTCFFGFIGFDTIASSAEEAKNPKRNVPLSIILSLLISSVAYMSIATIQTLVWPYYDQQCETVLPYIFNRLNMPITYWIVTVGALAGLASSQLAGMIPLPRTLYSMANDRLIYHFLAKISKRFKIPLRAVVIGSILVAPLAATVDTDTLANMVSIGTLAAYTVVSLSVLILRYEKHRESVDDDSVINNHLNFVEIFNTLDSVEHAPNSISLAATSMKDTNVNLGLNRTNNNNHDNHNNKDSTDLNLKMKRSRLLKPQLSLGFQSWFRTSSDNPNMDGHLSEETRPEEAHVQQSTTNVIDQPSTKTVPMSKLIYKLFTFETKSSGTADCPTDQTSKLSKILITVLVILCTAFDIIAYICINSDMAGGGRSQITGTSLDIMPVGQVNLLVGGCIVIVLIASTLLLLTRLPKNCRTDNDSFRVPLLPFIPTLSILVNVYLMLSLDFLVWVRFLAWMAIGFFIYFSYGIWESIGFMVGNIDQH